jgi:DNA primase
MVDQSVIDRVIETAQIVEVVQDFITLKRRGANFLGNCPFHNEKTPSFTVSPAKGIFKCFGCGKGGNSVSFVMDHEHLNFTEAIKFLAKKYNIEIIEKELSERDVQQKNERESLQIVSDFAQKYFSDTLLNNKEGKAIGLSYFKERGFSDKTIEKFQLGYSVDKFDEFTVDAQKKGYKLEYLVKTGLTINSNDKFFDRFSGRVIFPIHSISGKVIGFGGRTLRTDKKTAKYQNSVESEIYHKSKVLYGLFFAKKAIVQQDKCFLVEGYADFISMFQAGIENIVASSGTSFTIEQIRLIKRFTQNITILYDGDSAGIKASIRAIDMILEEGLNVKVVLFPDGDDPDSYARKVSSSELSRFIAENENDFITFKTKMLIKEAEKDPVQKANLIKDVVHSISIIPDAIAMSVYIRECSSLLKVDEQILYHEVVNLKRKKRESQKSQASDFEAYEEQFVSPKQSNPTIVNSERLEYEIVRLMLNYGNHTLMADENGVRPTVAKYIINELNEDELQFSNHQYLEIYNEIISEIEKNGEINKEYFINHKNSETRKITVEMLFQPYELSEIWKRHDALIETEDMKLNAIVPETIIAYKNVYVVQELKRIAQQLSETKDDQEINDLMERSMKMKEIHRIIQKRLGDRIIS